MGTELIGLPRLWRVTVLALALSTLAFVVGRKSPADDRASRRELELNPQIEHFPVQLPGQPDLVEQSCSGARTPAWHDRCVQFVNSIPASEFDIVDQVCAQAELRPGVARLCRDLQQFAGSAAHARQ